MGGKEVIITKTAAQQVDAVLWFIELKGLFATAEDFTTAVYGFLLKLPNTKKSYAFCSEPARNAMG